MKNYILDLDKPRKLRFGFKAIRMIRDKFGNRSVDQLMNIKVDEIPVLAWAALKWDDKSLTLEKVEDLLDAAIPEKYTIMDLIELIMGAMAAQIGIQVKKATAGVPTKKEADKAFEAAEKVAKEITEKKTEPTKTTVSSKKPKKQP